MNETLWRTLWVVVVIALVGCAGSSGPTAAVTVPNAGAGGDAAAQPVDKAMPNQTADKQEPLSNRLKWSTASEVDNFGFDIYRSTSEDGPFDRITSQAIPGAGTVDAPQYYEFVDDSIDAGIDYYYYIESISVDGIRERFSPIIRAPAKHPAAAGASEVGP
jgi:hypothetical protein